MHTLIQKSLKVKLRLKPEVFILGQMDRQLENNRGTLFLYMITTATIICSNLERFDNIQNG